MLAILFQAGSNLRLCITWKKSPSVRRVSQPSTYLRITQFRWSDFALGWLDFLFHDNFDISRFPSSKSKKRAFLNLSR